jgi:hypothetical protein
MPPDPERLADTESWLRKSANDLRYARIDLVAEPSATEDAVFHCQQAVEKALKAFLVWQDAPFVKTHDLGKLGALAVQFDATLAAHRPHCRSQQVCLDVPLPGRSTRTDASGSAGNPRPCFVRRERVDETDFPTGALS